MKTSVYTAANGLSVLLFSILSLIGTSAIAQGTTGTASNYNMLHYVLAGIILVLLIATIYMIQKAIRILDQYGHTVFEFNFPIFLIMAKNDKTVAVVMALIVLLGIYFVVTYGA